MLTVCGSPKQLSCKLEARVYCLQSIRQGPNIALSSAWLRSHTCTRPKSLTPLDLPAPHTHNGREGDRH